MSRAARTLEKRAPVMFCSAAVERGIDYAVGVGSPEVEATEEDLNYVPPED